MCACIPKFQSPRGDFGFLKHVCCELTNGIKGAFQSPRGDFGFLKAVGVVSAAAGQPLRFNPLAGILVF